MPDTIVEFINVKGKTQGELQAGVPIVVNAANEQAVVKDVLITCTKNRETFLEVGGSVVASMGGDARLTGSELIGAGTRMTLKTAQSALLNIYYSVDTTSFFKNQFETLFKSSADSNIASVETRATQTSFDNIAATPNFICIAVNGDLYYADGVSGTLYRRAGGPAGAETSFSAFGHTLCYDGSRYIYGFNNNNQVETLDTQTATVTNIAKLTGGVIAQASPSFAHCCAIDGWVWCHPQYNNTSFLVNPANGICYEFGGFASGSGQRFFVGVNKDNAGNYVFVQLDYTAPYLYYWSPGKTLGANPSEAFRGSISKNPFGGYSGNANYLHRIPGVDNLLFYIGNKRVYAIDLTTFSVMASRTLLGCKGGDFGTFYGVDAAAVPTDFGTVGVRATGIKVTP